MMKTGLFLYARMNSYRLPGKVLLEVMGRPMLSHQIERLKKVREADLFVLLTTELTEDDVLVDLARKEGLPYFRGSISDLIERMFLAARAFEVDAVIATGGDNIFADPPYADRVIRRCRETGADYLYCPDLPVGCSLHAAQTSSLEKIHRFHKGKTDHGWDLYFLKNESFRVETVPVEEPELRRPELRMTMDYAEDFRFFKAIMENLFRPGDQPTLKEIIQFIDAHPEIAALGQERAGDWEHLREVYEKDKAI